MYNVFKNIKSSLKIILQAIPEDVDVAKIESAIQQIVGVVSFHDLHIWSLDGQRNVLTVHVVLVENLPSQHEVKVAISAAMHELGIDHCTIETEIVGEDCVLKNC